MAIVEITEKKAPMANARPTMRLRWWHPLDGEPELQQAWVGEWGPEIWLPIPIHAEKKE